MIVLKATQQQYEQLNGYSYKNNILEFQIDGNGNYIVGLQVLENNSFLQIKDQLQALERIEYIKPQENE